MDGPIHPTSTEQRRIRSIYDRIDPNLRNISLYRQTPVHRRDIGWLFIFGCPACHNVRKTASILDILPHLSQNEATTMVGHLLILSVIFAVIATAFFLLGNTRYQGKGLFFATLSILVSFIMVTFPPYPWISLAVGNGLLYLGLWWPTRSQKK